MDLLQDKSLSSISKHVHSKMTSSMYSQSWCNRTVRRLSRWKHQAFRKARQNSNRKNWTRYKNIQKACKDKCKKAYNNYVCDMVNDASNWKKLFSFIKDKKCDSSCVAPLKKDGTTHNDAPTKWEILNSQFLSTFTTEDTRSFPELRASHYPDTPEITAHPNAKEPEAPQSYRPGRHISEAPQRNGRAAHSYTDSDFLSITQTRKDTRRLEGGNFFFNLQKMEIKVNRPITDLYHWHLFAPKFSNTSSIIIWWTSLRTNRSFVTKNMVSGNIDHANHSYWQLSKISHLVLTTRSRSMSSYLTFQKHLIRCPIKGFWTSSNTTESEERPFNG